MDMKTIKKLILITAAFALPFALSCNKEKEYEKGAPENDNPYAVYFDVPASTDFSLAPDEETVVEFTVKRKDVNGEITVPYTLESENADVFELSDLVFEDGAEEATIEIRFPDAEIGKKYAATLIIDDPEYTHIYSSDPVAMNFSVIRINWLPLGTGTWTDALWSDVFGAPITDLPCEIDVREDLLFYNETTKAYEYNNSQSKYIFRVKSPYTAKVLFDWFGEEGETLEDYEELAEEAYILVDATDPKKVWIDYQYAGAIAFQYGYVSIATMTVEVSKNWTDDNYGNLKDGIITFPVANSIYFELSAYGGLKANSTGKFKIMLPGAKIYDYEVKLAPGFADEEGVMPVAFDFSEDVVKVAYDCFEGELTGSAVKKAGEALAEDKAAKNITEPGSVDFTFETTGVYTLVAAAIDKDGKLQGTFSTTLDYLAAGDEDEVEATIGLDNVSGKYGAQGISPENALEAWIYGKKLKEVKIGLFDYLKVASGDVDEYCELVKDEGIALEEKDLALANGEGYSTVIQKLVPGTKYILIIWASNGFSEDWFAAEATTAGDPLPIYQNYDLDSWDNDYALKSEAELLGEWNYYATDYYGTLGMREYLGKVTFTDSETADDPDEGDYYVVGTGFSAGGLAAAAYYGLIASADDSIEFDLYYGLLYLCANKTVNGIGSVQFYSPVLDDWYSVGASWYIGGIPVGDGYYAFMDVSQSQSYHFSTWRWIAGGYIWTAFDDVLIVDPAKDDNGVIPESVEANIKAVKRTLSSSVCTVIPAMESAKISGRAAKVSGSGKAANEFKPAVVAPMGLRKASYSVSESHKRIASREIRQGLQSVSMR